MSTAYTVDVYGATHVVDDDMKAVENNFAALRSNFSATAAPSSAVACQWWADTKNNLLEIYSTDAATYYDVFDFTTGKVVAAAGGMAAGIVAWWPTSTCPSGYLECDGAGVSRVTYSDLFAAIGTVWGASNATSFKVPRISGYFIRAWDHGQGVDPDAAGRIAYTADGAAGCTHTGDTVGSLQGSTFYSHAHAAAGGHNHIMPREVDAGGAAGVGVSGTSLTGLYAYSGITPVQSAANHSHAAAGGNETRPINVYLMPIIKT